MSDASNSKSKETATNHPIISLKQFDEEIERIVSDANADRPEILYRGQADSSLKITSTLERIGVEEISCKEYYQHIDSLKPLINPLIEKRFDRRMTRAGYPFEFADYGPASWELPEMEYLTYLRHHGFPTPIIDFTESHYIALFFACENFVDSKTNGKVFAYIDKGNAGKLGGNDIPDLRRIGRYVETAKRHFAQQSQYLIPSIYEKEWKFISVKRVVDDNTNQYHFKEIEIANYAKRVILKELRRMNINRYTMYLNEDSLIRNFADEFSHKYGASNLKE